MTKLLTLYNPVYRNYHRSNVRLTGKRALIPTAVGPGKNKINAITLLGLTNLQFRASPDLQLSLSDWRAKKQEQI